MRTDWLVHAAASFHRPAARCLLLLLVVPGCRQSPTTVSGTVALDGKPLSVASDARGTVIFQPVGGQGTTLTGLVDSTGRFRLATGASSEIAPGRYDVAISVVQLLPKTEQAPRGAQLITPARYASAKESGLGAEVAPGENRLRFNLSSTIDDDSSAAPDCTSSAGARNVEPAEHSSEENQE